MIQVGTQLHVTDNSGAKKLNVLRSLIKQNNELGMLDNLSL